MNKKLWFVNILAVMLTVALAGGVYAQQIEQTFSQGGTTSLLVGNPVAVPSSLQINEEFMNVLWAVEDNTAAGGPAGQHIVDQTDGQVEVPPDGNNVYNGANCNGEKVEITVTLNSTTATWVYAPTQDFGTACWIFGKCAGHPWSIPGGIFDFLRNSNSPASAPLYLMAGGDTAHDYYNFALSAERDEFGVQINTATTPDTADVSQCYEGGHPVAHKYNQDPFSGFQSVFDAVVYKISSDGKTLHIHVIRRSIQGSQPGVIVIPGSVFKVDLSGAEAEFVEAAPLTVTVTGSNPALQTEQVQIATVIPRDNTASGDGQVFEQVVVEGQSLREIPQGTIDGLAGSLQIREQINGQFVTSAQSAFQLTLPNGIEFHSAPQITASGGLEVSPSTTSFPSRTFVFSVTQNLTGAPNASLPGTIRVFDIHLDVDQNFPIGNVSMGVAATRLQNNLQSIQGFDDTSVNIARIIGGVTVGGNGAGSDVTATVSESSGKMTLKLDVRPPQDVNGQLYISLRVRLYDEDGNDLMINVGTDDDPKMIPFGNIIYLRPSLAPTADGFWVVMGGYIDSETYVDGPATADGVSWNSNAAGLTYKSGALSRNAQEETFIVGLKGLGGSAFRAGSWYKLDGASISDAVAIQQVNVIVQ
jgi:hypothetical protein